MLPFLKKKPDDQASALAPAAATPRDLSDYIPYYSHYNAHTLLTKNGEVMQTIRIRCNNEGLNYESGESDAETVREHVRAAIAETLTTDEYALWIHTIRRRKKVTYSSKVADPFASYVNNEWQKTHHWKFQYYNEIFVSILHTGQGGDLFDKKILAAALRPKTNRAVRNQFLDRAVTRLDAATSAMLARIRTQYRAERLSIVERQGIFYSEPMEFLGKVLNLRTEPFPVRECDISQQLFTHAVTFGFNALETRDATGSQRFGALLSLKQYREVPLAAADRLMQAPVECIVSQAFVFTPAKSTIKEYQQQKAIFQVSGDSYSIQASGLEEMLDGNLGRTTDYGTLQTTVTIITDEFKQLDVEVARVQAAFGDMGLITVREDIKLEECFWSQLPGNFAFIRRKDVVPTSYVSGFARLNLFPDGKDSGNHWGNAVALIPTYVDSPYFFNFHQRDNGHTVLLDFNPFNDNAAQVLSNFLITSALKFNGRIVVFDRKRSAQLLFDKLNGPYHSSFTLNPFSLPDEKRSRGFLLAWLSTLAGADDAARAPLESAIDHVYAETPERRNFSAFITALTSADAKLAVAFKPYANVFNAEIESLDFTQKLQAFDMDAVLKRDKNGVAVFAYLMHRVILALDGKPTIIVLHEAFDLLDNPFFAPRLESLLDMLTQNNALLFCTAQKPEACAEKPIFATLLSKAATLICLPDGVTPDYAAALPQLTTHDDALLAQMDRERGDFLVKQGKETISLRANLNDMEATKAIFSGDIKTLIAAGGPFATLPKDHYDKASA